VLLVTNVVRQTRLVLKTILHIQLKESKVELVLILIQTLMMHHNQNV